MLVATFICAAIGTAAGAYVGFAKTISNMVGLGGSQNNLVKYGLRGAFLGAAVGVGGTLAVDAYQNYNDANTVNSCVAAAGGEDVRVSRDAQGKLTCAPL